MKCEICVIVRDEFGVIRCDNCRKFFTKKAIENNLKKRFGSNWEIEKKKLRTKRKWND